MEAERLSLSITNRILGFDWLIHPGVSYSRERRIFQATAQGKVFRLFAFSKTTRMASTEEEFRQVSYFIYMHFNFLFLSFHL